MAPHVSRFLQRLFDVDAPASAIAEATRAQDDLFRFKVDFVRRRALPLLKNGAHVASTPEDEAIVEAMIAGAPAARPRAGDRARRLRAARSREKPQVSSPQPPAPSPDSRRALKRWCAARIHDRAYRDWVIFRFPENVEPFHLVEVEHPDPRLPEAHDRSRRGGCGGATASR